MDGVLQRLESTDQGTFGKLTIGQNIWATGELPWLNNEHNKSCIPAGDYIVRRHHDEKHGECLSLDEVPGRSGILIHAGNFCGNVDKGFRSDSEGCILVGITRGIINDQPAVLSSKSAMRKLLQSIPATGIMKLTII